MMSYGPSCGSRTCAYDVENRLTAVYQGGVLRVDVAYDPLGRIKRTSTPTTTEQYLWDGDRLVGTFDGSSIPTDRWLHGPGPDEPLAQLLSPRRWLLADHQGSITAEADASGAPVGTPYTYDPYGRPDAAHGFAGPRFRYTGQTALVPTVPLWHYKARAYDPAIGRFLQTDPIGYEDSLNLYQYVGNDPFNATDPSGLAAVEVMLEASSGDQCPDPPCRDGEQTARDVLGDTVGAAGDAAQQLDPHGASGYAAGLGRAGAGATAIIQTYEGVEDVRSGRRTSDQAVVERGARTGLSIALGAEGALEGGLAGARFGPYGTVAGAVTGGVVGSGLGDRGGEVIGAAYRWGKSEVIRRGNEFGRGFDDWVGNATGYRPLGTR